MTVRSGTSPYVARKWRPRLSLVVFAVLSTVFCLPLIGLYLLRIDETEFVHQTEAELIAQAAVLAPLMRDAIEAGVPGQVFLGAPVEPRSRDAPQQISPQLDPIRDAVLAPRPEAQVPNTAADPAFLAVGAKLTTDLVEAQQVTLTGFRLLDPNGVVIAGREEIGQSLAQIEEVHDALQGRFRSVLRRRLLNHERPPLDSISRGADIRVFVAMPVVLHDHVAGVIYLSRTPPDLLKELYSERRAIAAAALLSVLVTSLIGYVFHRAIMHPIGTLIARTKAIGKGDWSAVRPLKSHGTAELAELSESFLAMADSLNRRSDFLSTFANHVSHELKSPLTSIKGAAELMRDAEAASLDADPAAMSAAEKRRFLDNIIADVDRLSVVAQRLRDLAHAETPDLTDAASFAAVVDDFVGSSAPLQVHLDGLFDCQVPMSAIDLKIVLSHLADNAIQHGATRLDLHANAQEGMLRLILRDNGAGISPNNRSRIFESFFTTRRESGGTGMGLAIVRAMLGAHGGSIELLETDTGTAFAVSLPAIG